MKRTGVGLAAGMAALAALAGAAAWQARDAQQGGVTVVQGRAAPAGAPSATSTAPAPAALAPAAITGFVRTPVASFVRPYAMVFLPDGRLLVTEKTGTLRIVTTAGVVSAPVAGVPAVVFGENAGLLDVALDPAFATNRRVFLTFAEDRGGGTSALAVWRATLALSGDGGRLDNGQVLWRAQPAIADTKHYGARMAFAPNGTLFLTSGDRHQGLPAQDAATTLGKIMRINAANGRASIVSSGHRNPYGLVFAANGRLYESEHGPTGGDEFNHIRTGANYGWPLVSEGSGGSGRPFPRHSSDPRFTAPLKAWTPSIAPAGMIQYRGTRFAGWTDDFLIGGLKSEAIVRVRVTGGRAAEVQRIAMGVGVRELEEGPDGAIWMLEDLGNGRLIRLDPVS